jgi:hypothetical protein
MEQDKQLEWVKAFFSNLVPLTYAPEALYRHTAPLWGMPLLLHKTGISYEKSLEYVQLYQEPGKILHAFIRLFLENLTTDCKRHAVHGAVWRGDIQEVYAKVHSDAGQWMKDACVCGQGPLTLAILLDKPDVVECLLTTDLRILECEDVFGHTALHWSVLLQHEEYFNRLIAYGANRHKVSYLGAKAEDYRYIFEVEKEWPLNLCVENNFGDRQYYKDNDVVFEQLKFKYIEKSLYSLDCIFQWIVSAFELGWKDRCREKLSSMPCFSRRVFPEQPLSLRYVSHQLGYGVFAQEKIKEGDPVTDYACPVVHHLQLLVNSLRLNHASAYYATALPDYESYQLLPWHFNGCQMGNLGTRINSSHEPEAANLATRCAFWRGLPRGQFFARRNINPGEQLCWFYGDSYWKKHGQLQKI